MARLNDLERENFVRQLMERIGDDEVRDIKADLDRRMVKGQRHYPWDVETTFAVLARLRARVLQLERGKEAAGPTEAEQFHAATKRLQRLGGVSKEVAERYIRERGDPLDGLRKHRVAAPDPEPALPRTRQDIERPDLRPQRFVTGNQQ